MEELTLEMASEIADVIERRQGKFNEPLGTSIRVVLLNYGDERRIAHCMSCDWSGPKSELAEAPSGLPLCPRCGAPCTEEAEGWGLALVDGVNPWG